jgi:hypothetical protein
VTGRVAVGEVEHRERASLDLAAGGVWETAIGPSNVPVLSGAALNNVLTGSDPADISNG